ADDPGHGADGQCQVGEPVIPLVEFAGYLLEFLKSGLRRKPCGNGPVPHGQYGMALVYWIASACASANSCRMSTPPVAWIGPEEIAVRALGDGWPVTVGWLP